MQATPAFWGVSFASEFGLGGRGNSSNSVPSNRHKSADHTYNGGDSRTNTTSSCRIYLRCCLTLKVSRRDFGGLPPHCQHTLTTDGSFGRVQKRTCRMETKRGLDRGEAGDRDTGCCMRQVIVSIYSRSPWFQSICSWRAYHHAPRAAARKGLAHLQRRGRAVEHTRACCKTCTAICEGRRMPGAK